MKLGYLYKVKESVNKDDMPSRRFFCFGNNTGRFIGYAGLWPRFSHAKGSESCINCANPDDFLEEVSE